MFKFRIGNVHIQLIPFKITWKF